MRLITRHVLALSALGSLSAASADTLTAIALTENTGTLGPNVELDARFQSFDGVVLVDASGGIVYEAYLEAGDNREGVWHWHGVVNHSALRNGDLSPLTGMPIELGGYQPNVGDDNVVHSTQDEVLVYDAGNATRHTLIHASQSPPGIPGSVYYGLIPSETLADANGNYLLNVGLTGEIDPNTSSVLMAGPLGGLSILARAGDDAPGLGNFKFGGFSRLSMASDGTIGVQASAYDTMTVGEGIWVGNTGGLSRLIMAGDPLPGGGVYGGAYQFSVGGTPGTVIVNGYSSMFTEGIWSGAGGLQTLVARVGDQVNGLPTGVLYNTWLVSPATPLLNEGGMAAILSALKGDNVDASNDQAIVAGPAASVQAIIRTGDPAPDIAGGTIWIIDSIALDNNGNVVFRVSLTDSAVIAALYRWDSASGVHLIAKTGDVVDLGGGDSGVIGQLFFTGAGSFGSGIASGLGVNGRVAFKADFLDGRQAVLMADLANSSTLDTDGDGVPDIDDAFPNDPMETIDTDGDGTGNNADTDDDNDGLSDADEEIYGTDPLNADTDGDGVSDGDEVAAGTDPLVNEKVNAGRRTSIIINAILLSE